MTTYLADAVGGLASPSLEIRSRRGSTKILRPWRKELRLPQEYFVVTWVASGKRRGVRPLISSRGRSSRSRMPYLEPPVERRSRSMTCFRGRRFKPKKLTSIEHFIVELVSPTMEAVSFVTAWNLVHRREMWAQGRPSRFSFSHQL